MQKSILKALSLFLCGLLIYNSLGYFLGLSVLRLTIRHQKWAQIAQTPEHQLTTFTFNKFGFNSRLKVVNHREIIVDGKLYDIVRKSERGALITFYCVRDAREQNLIAKIRVFNSETQPLPVKNTAQILIEKIIKNAIISKTALFIEFNICEYSSVASTNSYIGPEIYILHPPPKS